MMHISIRFLIKEIPQPTHVHYHPVELLFKEVPPFITPLSSSFKKKKMSYFE